MALKKVIKNEENGLQTEHHRVGDAMVINGAKNIVVTIYSYASEEYRQKEKEMAKYTDALNAKQAELSTLVEQNENKKYNEQIAILASEINNMPAPDQAAAAGQETHLTETVEILSLDETGDFSFAGVYQKLKELPKYAGAEDV